MMVIKTKAYFCNCKPKINRIIYLFALVLFVILMGENATGLLFTNLSDIMTPAKTLHSWIHGCLVDPQLL